ncbi:hypothetical protein JYT72_00170 [Crocinitomix catalasitica]|nr:hypothetical protein [Crocinitomix catalasitica]
MYIADKAMTNPPDNFTIFRSFQNMDQAHSLIELLKDHSIKYHLIENRYTVDITFVGSSPSEIQLLIHKESFSQVNHVLEKEAENSIDKLPDDYYLFAFSDMELVEILEKPDEWSVFDFVLAKKLLRDRGQEVNLEKITELNQKRMEELETGRIAGGAYLFFGYLFAFAGGLFGIAMGYFLYKQKTNLPDGRKSWTYHEASRAHGKNMFFIGIVLFIIFVLYRTASQIEFFQG